MLLLDADFTSAFLGHAVTSRTRHGQEHISKPGSETGFHLLEEESRDSFFQPWEWLVQVVFQLREFSVLLSRFLEHDEIWRFEDKREYYLARTKNVKFAGWDAQHMGITSRQKIWHILFLYNNTDFFSVVFKLLDPSAQISCDLAMSVITAVQPTVVCQVPVARPSSPIQLHNCALVSA